MPHSLYHFDSNNNVVSFVWRRWRLKPVLLMTGPEKPTPMAISTLQVIKYWSLWNLILALLVQNFYATRSWTPNRTDIKTSFFLSTCPNWRHINERIRRTDMWHYDEFPPPLIRGTAWNHFHFSNSQHHHNILITPHPCYCFSRLSYPPLINNLRIFSRRQPNGKNHASSSPPLSCPRCDHTLVFVPCKRETSGDSLGCIFKITSVALSRRWSVR